MVSGLVALSMNIAAAALALDHLATHQRFDRFHGVLLFHRAVTRVVEQIARLLFGTEFDVFFKQKLVNVNNAAAWEDLVKLVALQLVKASATAHHHGFDVEVVERVGHAVEQHAVVGDDLLGLVKLARPFLRIAAAQVAGWQHGLHARVPQHGLRG